MRKVAGKSAGLPSRWAGLKRICVAACSAAWSSPCPRGFNHASDADRTVGLEYHGKRDLTLNSQPARLLRVDRRRLGKYFYGLEIRRRAAQEDFALGLARLGAPSQIPHSVTWDPLFRQLRGPFPAPATPLPKPALATTP